MPKGKQHPAAVRGPTGNQLKRDRIEAGVRLAKIDQGYSFARTVAKTVGVVLVAYFLYLAVQCCAGKDTNFNAAITTVLKMSADRWVAYALAAVAGGGYLVERRQRKRVISEHADYIRELETRIDPTRSRSHLTLTGDPTKEDLDGA